MTATQTTHNLSDVASLTELIRRKEREIEIISAQRKTAVLRHRESTPPVPYADLAEAMDVSEVTLYKIIRGKDGPLRARKRA